MWMMLGLLRLISLLPYTFQMKAGAILGLLLKTLMPKRNQIIDINLSLCFPEKDTKQRREISQQCFKNIGTSLVEMGLCWWWTPHRLKQHVEIRGLHYIEECLAQNQGVILLTGHFTSLEIGARLLTLFMPIQVMYRTQKNRLFDSYLYTKRDAYFEHTISRKNTRGLIKGIKKLIPTWYAPDQDFKRENNVFAPFFNMPTATITASSRLAKMSNAKVFPYFPERKADGSGYILHIDPALKNFPSDDDLVDATAINQSIEKYVSKHPAQYMWIHKRFNTRPEGEAKVY